MSKILQEKYKDVNGQVDNIIREANTEIGTLREKIVALQNEQSTAKRKNSEINESLQEKNKQFHKLQTLYDKLRRKSLISPIQNGATQNLDEALINGNMRGPALMHNRGQPSQVQNAGWQQGENERPKRPAITIS
ncbi:Putative uncharacterized protein [Taphrina deformans PYCC 5710]|uniref:Uncharacterized protein n=1 Tax=Taphrina deformans (strain PYCC 5710 / ATCC 11124 / CBS 356.35 / IMI 108563 / JCM 9778 / NBRC 8474) TaxID=1097556 RepID=R4X7S0_TAPDE|nr:Putative uncharacterized protein [Taphrina deformans PYCC 5710]|eukprot:CCG81233.1 Putative uncharacterized protein [Taphrina deformans PYCC 5710]